MKNIKLVALDMDGTLLNDELVVPEYTQSVIREAEAQGIKVMLCTGRPLAKCYPYAKELGLSSYIITVNGAEVWTMEKELVERHTMEASQIEELWEIGHRKHLHMWLVSAEEVFVKGERPDRFQEYRWLKMGYGQLDEQKKEYVRNELAHISDIEVTNSSRNNIEVNHAGVHKLRAIESVRKLLGIELEEVMAVGDSLNDLKMIQQVGLGVAVGNAQQAIIDVADYVTVSNNEEGVGKAIEKFVIR